MSIISISKLALNVLNMINTKYGMKYISFGIKSGGCSGFEYYLKPCNESPKKYDELIKVDDINIKIDGDSMLHIIGTEIDWEDNIMGKKFIFNNPNAEFNCGCGKSFS
jgi:iron-sulfur cluster assembly accessory protein